METMADFREELEASLKEDAVLVDLKNYADGIIRKEDLSDDPEFNMLLEIHPGDEITATVMATNDGEGNMVLSKKEANAVLAWDKLKQMMEDRTMVKVKIQEVVNAGAIAYLEGIRGFIPASRLSDEYVEELTIEVTVITADEESRRLVLSGREAAREKKQAELGKKIAKCEVGAVMSGTVETLKDYGAFVALENGLTGLLHISQISTQRIKHPGAVLKEGQEVTVKIISTENNKISLSMKVLAEEQAEAESHETFDYKEEGQASTGLGALLKGLKFN